MGATMRALTLTQPWAGLVASGIKLVENRPRAMIKRSDVGEPFAIHASRQWDAKAYARIIEIAPELDHLAAPGIEQPWARLARALSAVIAVATVDKVLDGGWTAETIHEHSDALCDSRGRPLGPSQVRWFFGPVGYVLRDVRALPEPVPCKGHLGYWTLPADVERAVTAQLQDRRAS